MSLFWLHLKNLFAIFACEKTLIKLNTVEPCYNEDFGTMKLTLLYQVSHYTRVEIKNKEIYNKRVAASKFTLL